MFSEGLRDVCSVLQLIHIYSMIKDSNFKLLADILNPRIVIIIFFLRAAAGWITVSCAVGRRTGEY